MDISEQVKTIVSQQLGVGISEVIDSALFRDDLGADSLAVVELTLQLQEHFNVEITDEDAMQIRTVGDAVSFIEKRLQAN